MQSFVASFLTALLLVALTPIPGFLPADTADIRIEKAGRLPADDLEFIRERVLKEVLAPVVDDAEIGAWVSALKPDGSWPGIDYEDVSRTGFQHRIHVSRLMAMSLAYRKSGSAYLEDATLKASIGSAIDFWIAHDFIADNWHTNEIGNPTEWTHILLLMDTALSAHQIREVTRFAKRANLEAWGARPGGDYIKIAGIMAEMALYERDEEMLETAVAAMASQIQISTGQGIQADLGFHHRTDRVTSILSYGTGYAGAFADWAVRLAGTRFAFPEAATHLLVDYYLDGICNAMVHGWYKDPGSINRSMSRKGSLKPISPELPEDLLRITDYRRDELANIVNIRKGEQAPNLTSNRFFWHLEYQSHQRPGYFASVRMFSDRNHNMEFPHNEESLKHHHYADGANFLSQTGREYYDIFPVWDWQKIPGTTVVQKPDVPGWREIVKEGKTDFVGGVSDGTYGAATFDFASPHDPLTAHKSWFFFDEAYVCLGAGIQSTADYPVATTLNQCLLNEAVVVKTARGKSTLSQGEHQLKAVSWVLHDDVGYLFPTPVDVSLRNQSYTGTWQSITHSTRMKDAKPEQKDLFALWIDHGIRPQAAVYEYWVVPGMDAEALARYEKSAPIKTLLNTPELQAVQHTQLNLTQAIFFAAGSLDIAKGLALTMDQPGMVMVKTDGRTVQRLTVADPTRKLRRYQLTLSTRLEGRGSNWTCVWDDSAKLSRLTIELPEAGLAGKSVIVDLNAKADPNALDTHGDKQPEVQAEAEHVIGERFGGGIVFWVDETGKHGLIAATEDQQARIRWENGPAKNPQHFGDHKDRVTNARGDGIGAGEMNTLLIIAEQTEDDVAGNFAAKVCANCASDQYGDWYLPSKAELKLLYLAREAIGGFSREMYWSSTEHNVGFAWGQSFHTYGGEYAVTKGSSGAVRCVRRF